MQDVIITLLSAKSIHHHRFPQIWRAIVCPNMEFTFQIHFSLSNLVCFEILSCWFLGVSDASSHFLHHCPVLDWWTLCMAWLWLSIAQGTLLTKIRNWEPLIVFMGGGALNHSTKIWKTLSEVQEMQFIFVHWMRDRCMQLLHQLFHTACLTSCK